MTEIILTITITLPIPEPPTPARAKKAETGSCKRAAAYVPPPCAL